MEMRPCCKSSRSPRLLAHQVAESALSRLEHGQASCFLVVGSKTFLPHAPPNQTIFQYVSNSFLRCLVLGFISWKGRTLLSAQGWEVGNAMSYLLELPCFLALLLILDVLKHVCIVCSHHCVQSSAPTWGQDLRMGETLLQSPTKFSTALTYPVKILYSFPLKTKPCWSEDKELGINSWLVKKKQSGFGISGYLRLCYWLVT